MSHKMNVDLQCPKCRTVSRTEIWLSVDARENPEDKKKLLDGKLNIFQCDNCDHKAVIPHPLLYYDMTNKFCVQLLTFDIIHDREFLEQFTDDGQLKIFADLPKWHIQNHFQNIHIIFSMEEMVRYIIFRDKLASRKKVMPSGIVCFSCGPTIMDNEPYFCIERFHFLKRSGTEQADKMIYATSSIQLCSKCAKKAGKEGIELKDRPLPLLMQIEKDGISQFAQEGNSIESKPNPIGTDKCQMCNKAIKVSDTYTRIDATKERAESGGSITKIGSQPIAVICTDCSQKYILWP